MPFLFWDGKPPDSSGYKQKTSFAGTPAKSAPNRSVGDVFFGGHDWTTQHSSWRCNSVDSCSWSFHVFHHQLVNKQLYSSVSQTHWLIGYTPSCAQFIIWGYPLWLFGVLLFWITPLYVYINISLKGFRIAGLKHWKIFHLILLWISAWRDWIFYGSLLITNKSSVLDCHVEEMTSKNQLLQYIHKKPFQDISPFEVTPTLTSLFSKLMDQKYSTYSQDEFSEGKKSHHHRESLMVSKIPMNNLNLPPSWEKHDVRVGLIYPPPILDRAVLSHYYKDVAGSLSIHRWHSGFAMNVPRITITKRGGLPSL